LTGLNTADLMRESHAFILKRKSTTKNLIKEKSQLCSKTKKYFKNLEMFK